jgi:RHS repeat-associated protein
LDTLHRLTQAQRGYGSRAYTYDGDGNRQSVTFGSSTTTYGYQSGSDLLTSLSMGGVVEQTLGYTADGRLNSINPGMESPGNQLISSATYNQDARLASFNAGGQPVATYTYDGSGQRLLKTVSSSYGNIYQYDQAGMLLEETDASGTAQADYIYLNDQAVADLDPSTATLSFLNDDRLGAPQLATDSGQNVVWQAVYDPFGQTPTLSGTITQNLRLPGQYFDAESSFYHNGFRDYLPSLGRYAAPDPLASPVMAPFYYPALRHLIDAGSAWLDSTDDTAPSLHIGMNPYSYVDSNPMSFIDPLGLCWIYHQSSGVMQHVSDAGNVDATINGGYSGHGPGVNNPAMQDVSGIGPLPTGNYSIRPMQNNTTGSGVLLRSSMRLTPDPTNDMFDRAGFLIHGDNSRNNHSASEGCIILNLAARNQIAHSDDHCLQVVP